MVFDVIIILFIALGGWQGYSRGLFAELVSMIYFLAIFVILLRLIGVLYSQFSYYVFEIDENILAQVLFIIIFLITILALNFINHYFKTEVEYDFPGAWDNVIGALVGIVRYVVAISFFLWALSAFGELKAQNFPQQSQPQQIQPQQNQPQANVPVNGNRSRTYNIVLNVAPSLFGYQSQEDLTEGMKNILSNKGNENQTQSPATNQNVQP